MTAPAAREIRARRPPVLRPTPSDPPIAETDLELEREPDGSQRPCSSVFLVGAECPFTCIFCDLWRNTLEVATPEGELPRQLRAALGALPADRLRGRIKLYNASNFFDPRAVPPGDLDEIAELVAPFERVVVECHARLVGDTCLDFAERLGGRLELALGLEVADDALLARLGKEMTLADFDRAAARLNGAHVPFRVFVLVGVPFASGTSPLDLATRSVEAAFARGAERVSLIPVRAGNGAMEDLAAAGDWRPPALGDLEEALDRALEVGSGPVAADLWDLDRLRRCDTCFDARRDRLARINDTGRAEARVDCRDCPS